MKGCRLGWGKGEDDHSRLKTIRSRGLIVGSFITYILDDPSGGLSIEIGTHEEPSRLLRS